MEFIELWNFLRTEAIPQASEFCNIKNGCHLIKLIAYQEEDDSQVQFFNVKELTNTIEGEELGPITPLDVEPIVSGAVMHAPEIMANNFVAKRLLAQSINQSRRNEMFMFFPEDPWMVDSLDNNSLNYYLSDTIVPTFSSAYFDEDYDEDDECDNEEDDRAEEEVLYDDFYYSQVQTPASDLSDLKPGEARYYSPPPVEDYLYKAEIDSMDPSEEAFWASGFYLKAPAATSQGLMNAVFIVSWCAYSDWDSAIAFQDILRELLDPYYKN